MLEPSKWHVGMEVSEDGQFGIENYTLVEWREPKASGMVGGWETSDAGFRNAVWLKRFAHPLSYSDLSRTPVAGERAVVIGADVGDEEWIGCTVIFGGSQWNEDKADGCLYVKSLHGRKEVLPYLAPLAPLAEQEEKGGQEGEGEWGKTDAICEGCGRRFVAPGSMRVCGPCSIPAPAPKSYADLGITSVKKGDKWVKLSSGTEGEWWFHHGLISEAEQKSYGPAPDPVPQPCGGKCLPSVAKDAGEWCDDRNGAWCSLPTGHTGEHVACCKDENEHGIHSWPAEPPVVETPEHERECERILDGTFGPSVTCVTYCQDSPVARLEQPCEPCALRLDEMEREQAEAARPVMGDKAAQDEHAQSMWYAGRAQDWYMREVFDAGFGAQCQGKQ